MVKKENIYKARHFAQNQQSYQEQEKEEEDTKNSQECFFCRRCGYLNFHHNKNDCVRLKNVKATDEKNDEREITDSDDDSDEEENNEEIEIEEDNSYHSAEEQMTDLEEEQSEDNLDTENEGESNEEDNVDPNSRYPTEGDEDNNGSSEGGDVSTEIEEEVAPRFRDPPAYKIPKKGDKIEYFKAKTDSWIKAKVKNRLPRYKDWFNVTNEDSTECSVNLTKDSLWRYEREEDNSYYFWRWEESRRDGFSHEVDHDGVDHDRNQGDGD